MEHFILGESSASDVDDQLVWFIPHLESVFILIIVKKRASEGYWYSNLSHKVIICFHEFLRFDFSYSEQPTLHLAERNTIGVHVLSLKHLPGLFRPLISPTVYLLRRFVNLLFVEFSVCLFHVVLGKFGLARWIRLLRTCYNRVFGENSGLSDFSFFPFL